jgi:uncharacterized protein YyaL (SSP411 family)
MPKHEHDRRSVDVRLAAETSPYLLQHADNPVDWYPWGRRLLRHSATMPESADWRSR